MIKEICGVLLGSFFWNFFRLKDGLNYSKVVLVLTGENNEVDRYALMYLDDIIKRKKAKEAIVYVFDQETKEKLTRQIKSEYHVQVTRISKRIMGYIYRRYMMERFYKNIFWTFTDYTNNNLLGRFIRETDITAEDVVCLAIYNFRCIPERINQDNVCS